MRIETAPSDSQPSAIVNAAPSAPASSSAALPSATLASKSGEHLGAFSA